ncbi:MAG: class I SAM-dependent methyltransferase [Bacteroidales bacterium]|nr:class I SAM-dependent methyltransferase [Bacteroidales bacterium]
MERNEILNYLIAKNGYKSYLEIGVAVPGMNYDLINCELKEGCDPYMDCFFDFGFNGADAIEEYKKRVTYLMTSDELFESMPEEKKYDIIFSDGDHSELQTKKDIINSLKHLNPNGLVVVHDVFPRCEEYAREERLSDEWYGCAYKAILDFSKIGGRFACVRQGGCNGVAIIPYQHISEEKEREYFKESEFGWSDYENDTDVKMRVVSLEGYGKKVMIYHNCKYLVNSPSFDRTGKLVYGGTESWVAGIAERLAKYGFNVTVFSDVRLADESEGVKYVTRDSDDLRNHFDVAIITTDIEIANTIDCDRVILAPTCEFFNTNFGAHARAEGVAILSEWQKQQFERVYNIQDWLFFRHFLPCEHHLYDDFENYEKENSMVWSSAPVRGLRFFVERVMPKIKKAVPDFKLYICGYDKNYYESEWPIYVDGVEPMISAGKKELAELQKKSKIWVYPNIGRSETSGFFYETYCITAVENALAGNAIVCLNGKDGIDSTLEGYDGFIDGNMIDEKRNDFMLHYEEVANIMAEYAIEILLDGNIRKALSQQLRKIAEKYTWDKETRIICEKII